MEINKLNVGQIVQVRAFLKYESGHYEYRENKKFLWIFPIEDGFYYTFTINSPYKCTRERIEKDGKLYVEGKKVFHYPHLEILMSSGNEYTKYFKTEQELRDFMDSDVMKGIKFIDK